MRVAIAVDVGGTKISAACVDSAGKILRKVRRSTDTRQDAVLKTITTLTQDLVSGLVGRSRRLVGIGIGIPGAVDRGSGIVRWAANLPGWKDVPLARLIEGKTRLPVFIDNDVNLALLGEQWLGSVRGAHNAVLVSIGTGIGGGILVGGRIYRGTNEVAGAIGWFAFEPRGSIDEGCHAHGCLENISAGPAIAKRAEAEVRGKREARSLLLRLAREEEHGVTAELVCRAAELGDELAKGIIEEIAIYLGLAIANIISFFDPEVVVVSGGLSRAGALILDPIREMVSRYAQPLAAQNVRIMASALGDDAPLLGAVRLVFERGSVKDVE